MAQLRTRDATLASELEAELDEARDETIYLKVKIRKNEPIARREYADLRDKIEDIRSRARDSGGRSYPIRATVTDALESEGIRGEAGRIGAGAGLGAIIGGILGGVKGALAGILIGGGGTIAATEGEDVTLAPARYCASGWIRV